MRPEKPWFRKKMDYILIELKKRLKINIVFYLYTENVYRRRYFLYLKYRGKPVLLLLK